MYTPTTATKKIFKLKKRIRGVSGGTSASKTISILIWLIDYCQTVKNETVSVVSESFPHLRRGAMRDFLNIMHDHKYFKDPNWKQSPEFTYTFETGTRLEFFSADQPSKVRGPRRDVLFINEANNIRFETFNQLEVRTRKIIWLDWNPVNEFWWYTDVVPHIDHDFITLTYKDNQSLDESIVKSIESRKHNANWWKVYGLGQLGEVEGRIYTGWNIIDELPHEARLEKYGLDFGYTNDPTAIVAVYRYNGGIVLDEVAYQKGLLNSQIASILKNIDRAVVIADSAEPKSIDEISIQGITILPSKKGPGSVNQGIQAVQDERISVTKRSVNIIREYRNYLWEKDRNEKLVNKPIDFNNHAMDALRYAISSMIKADRNYRQPNRPRITYRT